MQKQKLNQRLSSNISLQQIRFLNLLQIPILSLNNRIQEELESNPVLEEDEDLPVEDIEVGNNNYKYRQNTSIDQSASQIQAAEETLQDHLKKQLLLLALSDRQQFVTEYLIDSLDESGWLNRDIFSISDDLLVNLNMNVSEHEIEECLSIIQTLEPYGVGARDLKECLIIQLNNQKSNSTIDLAKEILEKEYDRFTKKNFEGISSSMNVIEKDLKEVYTLVEKLNPLPASNFSIDDQNSYIYPDFTVTHSNDEFNIILPKSSNKELKINPRYKKMLDESDDPKTRAFLKEKINGAIWFKNAIIQRDETMFKVMSAIVNIQQNYFRTGDENKLAPMKLADISLLVQMDVSTISRVTNSKYVDTFFGMFLLKDLFSEAYTKDNGEKVSTKIVKNKLKEIIKNEDKRSPYTDERLCELLGENEYHIARRTVAKYREGLGLQTAKYRRML